MSFDPQDNGGIPPFGGANVGLVLPPGTGTVIKWGAAPVGVPTVGVPSVPGAELSAISEEIQRIRKALEGVEEGFSEMEEALSALLDLVEQEEGS